MANMYFERSEAPLRTIKEVHFGLFSPEELKNMSVANILYPETMDETKLRPREQGLNDPRLGSIDRQFKCATCDQGMTECPGHFGHIELAKPVYHPGYIKKVKKVLESVCNNCGKILLDDTLPAYKQAARITDPKRRFDAIWRLCKGKMICEPDDPNPEPVVDGQGDKTTIPKIHGGCGNVQPEVRHSALQLWGTWKFPKDEDGPAQPPEKKQITPEMALQVLRSISPKQITELGFNIDYARPEWMILQVLPVPPPPVRPSISMDGTGQGMRGEDDLTYKLGDIIRANGHVRNAYAEGAPAHIANDFETLLQYHVATLMDNDIAGQPQALQKSGRPVKSIRSRLKGKEGRLRGNLMGKRVDFSARTVITGDPNLDLDEVGVPRSIARTLTYPEMVTPYNISKLHQLVQNGPNEHPGAKYVIRADGSRIDLRYHKQAGAITLEYGWKVERHLQDGDYIIFNRQPSLHKESMMGHRVRVMPYSTFRLNLSVTSPYNADFDGDEMNLHVPQSEETRAEVRELCMVPLNIVSPQRNGPLMGILQDTLAGVYKMCRRDVFLDKEQMMNNLLWVPEWDGVVPVPAIVSPAPRWTGKQLISLIIPKLVNLYMPESDSKSPVDDKGLLVHEGELMYGLLAKKNVGASSGGIIHIIFNEQGSDAAMAFFNGCQRVVNYWLLHNGFSVGIGDTIPDKPTIINIQAEIDAKKEAVKDLTLKATNAQLESLPGMNVRETFESLVAKELNAARDKAGSVTEVGLKDLNNAVQMARSGSKGSTINISQMSACVGQQSVEGKRIPFGFKYRTLPHFTKDDYSPESRGFVENSYLRGLTPTEFFFHAMAGREGLIDTAVKTAETGYIQRRLVKALEDIMARHDGTIRNSLGDIVQFIYGEDGLDAVHIEKQRVDHIFLSTADFNKVYQLSVTDPENPPDTAILEHAKTISGDLAVQTLLDEEYDQLVEDRKFLRQLTMAKGSDETMQLPLNVIRMIESAKKLFKCTSQTRSDLHPNDVIPEVQRLLDSMVVVRGDDPLSREAQRNATFLIKAQIRSRLAYKRVTYQHRLTKIAFRHILGELESRFARSLVAPGEMVGVLAAQSIGEPATQMTLNTFHFAGVSSKNVTLGVPRLKEILNLATNIKTPSMVVYCDEEFASQETAKRLRSAVEHTNLRSVTAMTEIYYDPDVMKTTIPADEDMVDSFFIIPEEGQDSPDFQSRWMLRITLDRQKMLDKGLLVEDVAAAIKAEYPKDLAIIFSDNNAEEQVIRVRMLKQAESKYEDDEQEEDVMLKRLEAHILDTLTLRGVPGVDRAFLNKENKIIELPNGKIEADKERENWYLDTSGTSLAQVLTIEGVDTKRTYTNHFVQVLEVFGIEATRSALMRELTQVLAFDGSYVNHRHLALLVDVMTSRGHLMAVTRHGINRADTGALMRCSFEETVEILLEAAGHGDLDDCRGISENVILGQLAPMGTGDIDVLLDFKMLETVISDNRGMGLGVAGAKGGDVEGAATPYDTGSPLSEVGYLGSPDYGASWSPIKAPGSDSPSGFRTEYSNLGYGNGGMSPYGGKSPGGYTPTSPFNTGASPGWTPTSPMGGYSPTSPMMSATSPYAASPRFSPQSPGFTPMSPMSTYSPTSPSGPSPTSPNYSPTSPSYSPVSPSWSPTSPAMAGAGAKYSPTSPSYSPTSPSYSPTSPHWSPTSPQFSSTRESPTSPSSPKWSPSSPQYSPTSPTSPKYSPTSPSQP